LPTPAPVTYIHQENSVNLMIRFSKLLFIVAFCICPVLAVADALMRNDSADASSIAQYYVDERGVSLELEIGLNSIDTFRNLMPDAIYQRLGHEASPIGGRLREFFTRDFAIIVDGEPLPGYVEKIGPSVRVLRDNITGEPLPVQEDAPQVVRAELRYPFPKDTLPEKLGLTARAGADIGFVLYHKGVAVNDYRYLTSGYTLNLDWEDPWYSRFDNNQLRRQYSEPMSGFIYVENFEVRKEIIVRPKDLQRWVDLGLDGRRDIPAEMQSGIKQKVGEFLSQHQAVTIDDEPAEGILESVNFLQRTLTSSNVIDPPELLQLDSAVIGAIFVYPRSGLPQTVVMDWDLWDERIQRIPVSAVDQAGPLPSLLEPDWRQLTWTNFLKNPDIPTLHVVETPVPGWQLWAERLLPLLVLLALASSWLLWRARSAGRSPLVPAAATFTFVAASAAAVYYGANNQPEQARAQAITGDLLHNIYRAFDYREEGDIYDVLERSVSGELLTDIFLETKRSLVLANQGGAAAKVKDVELANVEVQPGSEQGRFTVEADWTVHGSVGHWGHVHQRTNRYLANLVVAVDGEQWKLEGMTVLQEERQQ
jgi:hypothetical protein